MEGKPRCAGVLRQARKVAILRLRFPIVLARLPRVCDNTIKNIIQPVHWWVVTAAGLMTSAIILWRWLLADSQLQPSCSLCKL